MRGRGRGGARRLLPGAAVWLAGAALGFGSAAADPSGFQNPEAVTVLGYGGELMEPFLARDGETLFFNNRNDPKVDTNLFLAHRVDGLAFAFVGPLEGVNSSALDAVASLDEEGNFYFVTTRSYAQDFRTLYRGRYAGGAVTDVAPVEGIARGRAPYVNFDAEISADGATLVYVEGVKRMPGAGWIEADLKLAARTQEGFAPDPRSDEILAAVNTEAWEYAPAISPDGRELFFTRLTASLFVPLVGAPVSPKLEILRASRPSADAPFRAPVAVAAIAGFVEAPTLSPDGLALYYHAMVEKRFALFRVTRGAVPDPAAE
ncbi:MAG: PD40 domain-containing protein [Alphaproteobacteria bacterium]|nr:PD40 domain-containing protein [Alphaproteobacteria bacterium]